MDGDLTPLGGLDAAGNADGADSQDSVEKKPRMATIVGLLALVSLTFSYLGSYAVSGALVQAEVVHRWPPGADPRPRWLAAGFVALLVVFVAAGCVVRHLSKRELKQIDEMAEESVEHA
jgi:hypothetical protein